MTDRERFLDLVNQALLEMKPNFTFEALTDFLLKNGVIVPPCKVGQTVYTKYGYSFKIQKIEILEDKKILFRCGNDGTDDYMAFYDFEIGIDVFLTEEKALAERSVNNG